MNQINFNAYDFEPTQGTSICFPLADYKVEITAAEMKVVKDNPSAGYLELSLTVTEGELRGQTQADRLNIYHTSEVPKLIAHRQLSAYCFAINRPFIQNTEQLIGGRLIATIGPQADNAKYSEVKVVKCMDGTLPVKTPQPGMGQGMAPAAPPPQAPSPPPANAAPWGGVPQQAQAAPVAGAQPQWSNSQAQPPMPPAPPAGATALPPWLKQ